MINLTSEKKEAIYGLAAVLVLAFLSRSIAVSYLDVEPRSDYAGYFSIAQSIAEEGRIHGGGDTKAFLNVGYPLLLAPVFYVFESTPQVAQWVNVALACISVWLLFLISKLVFRDPLWALLPPLMWIAYPPALLYTEYLAKENLMIPLFLSQTLLLLKHINGSTGRLGAFLVGVIFGYSLLVGTSLLFTGLLVVAVLSGLIPRYKLSGSWASSLVLFFVGCLVSVGPWLSHTKTEIGDAVITTNGGFNLYLGNNPNATGLFIGIQETPIGPQWHKLREDKGELGASQHLKGLALEHIMSNPIDSLKLSFKKAWLFWMPPIHEGEGGNKSDIETAMRFAWLLTYSVILVLALVPLLSPKKLNANHGILYLSILLYFGIFTIAYVIYRYRLPIMPLMSVTAVVGLRLLLDKFRHTSTL